MKKYRLCPSSYNTYILSRKDGHVSTKEDLCSFFPLAIGCEWEYDESGLTSQGYCAKRVMKIPCGHGGNYLMQDSQEFYYRGSDEEYDTFIAELARMSE